MVTDFSVIDRTFESFFAAHCPPGLFYCVCKEGEIIHSGHHGVSRLDTGAVPTAQTLFRIASLSKSFTAVSILQLRDRGQIELDTPVRNYIRTPLSDVLGRATVRQLLSMTADLPADDPWGDRQVSATDETLTKLFAEPALESGLGTRCFSYSNFGYMLLGRLVRDVTGMPFAEFSRREILVPLGLTQTSWDTPADTNAVAIGYARRGNGFVPEPRLTTVSDGIAFASITTTATDLARWMSFLGDHSRAADAGWAQVLRPDSRRELQQCSVLIDCGTYTDSIDGTSYPELSWYGFGLCRTAIGRRQFIHHIGGLPGFSSYMRWHLESSLGILAFSNLTYCPVWNACRPAMMQLVSDTPRELPAHLREILLERGKELVQLFREWTADRADRTLASNVRLDRDLAELRREIEAAELHRSDLQPDINVIKGLRAEIRYPGNKVVTFELGPLEEGRVQWLEIKT